MLWLTTEQREALIKQVITTNGTRNTDQLIALTYDIISGEVASRECVKELESKPLDYCIYLGRRRIIERVLSNLGREVQETKKPGGTIVFNIKDNDPNEFSNYEGSSGNTKSLPGQRIKVVDDVLYEASAHTADERKSAPYVEVRTEVAKRFVEKFGMLEDGAKKVASDTLHGHTLHLRTKHNITGEEVIFLKAAWIRTQAALEVINGLPANASSKTQLEAVRKALNLPAPKTRKQKEGSHDE